MTITFFVVLINLQLGQLFVTLLLIGSKCVLCVFCNVLFECVRVGVKFCVSVLGVLILKIAPKILIVGVGSDGVFVPCGFILCCIVCW